MSYLYEIQGNYGHGWDTLTTEETRALALDQLKVYRENERIPLRMKRVNA